MLTPTDMPGQRRRPDFLTVGKVGPGTLQPTIQREHQMCRSAPATTHPLRQLEALDVLLGNVHSRDTHQQICQSLDIFLAVGKVVSYVNVVQNAWRGSG